MNFSIEKIVSEVRSTLQNHYAAVIKKQVALEVQLMTSIIEEIKSFGSRATEKTSDHHEISRYKTGLRQMISDHWTSPEKKQFAEHYGPLTTSLQETFSNLDEKHINHQNRDRFYNLGNDSAGIKILKLVKRTAFNVSTAPLRVANIFRKEKPPIPYWKHTILYKNLIIKHFHIDIIRKSAKITDLVFSSFCEIYVKIKLSEENSAQDSPHDNDKIDPEIDKLVQNFQKDLDKKIGQILNEILVESLKSFKSDYQIAGTVELSSRSLSKSKIEKNLVEAEKGWSKQNSEWINTIYALFEDWRNDLAIHTLKHQALAEYDEFQNSKDRKIEELIEPKIKPIQEFLIQAIDTLSKKQGIVQREIKKINYSAVKKLDAELVPQLSDTLSSQPVNNLVNKLDSSISGYIDALSDEHTIVKSDNYNQPLKSDELHRISSQELIVFETLTSFQSELNTIKNEFFKAFESATTDIKDLDHIATFSLTAAISAIEEDKKTEEEARTIALEGVNRALNRLNETKEKLDESLTLKSELLEKAVHRFCDDIMELTINENVLELRLRITKAKATKQAKKTIWQLKKLGSIKGKQAWLYIKNNYTQLQGSVQSISSRFILTANKPVLTKQVSDFLIEYQQAMNGLPVIYKRLYQIEPLQDMELFEGREIEQKELTDAFSSWERGRFSATVIIGEKWGGLTTFINYFIKKTSLPYPIRRFAPNKNIYSEDKLINMLKTGFKNDELKEIDQVVNFLNDGSKKIIILEDLQNLYLRKIEGFATLKLLFQIMARTYNHVFWVMTTTLYTWQYLTKTISIPEYFSYIIELKELSHEQVINIIWKRNRISGFKIFFDVDPERLNDKKFARLDEDERQLVLKKEFFAALNSFAKSNVSLALIFWLLSTKSITDNSIIVGTFKNPNLNFLNILSMDKVYILHALILHDGLTEIQLNEVLYTTNTTTKLLLLELLQDGVVQNKEDVIMVNPIVYRSIISLLKSKNLIH